MIFQKEIQQGLLVIRYPTSDDAVIMQHYFNALSAEKTYIRSQGEQISLKEEKLFLEKVLKNIEEKKAVRLLAFLNDTLIGIANIDLSLRTEKHRGELGISIAKEYRGLKIGSIFIKVLMEESIRALSDLEIITLSVFSPNQSARILYKNLGFVEYGILPKGVKLENGYYDAIYMYKKVRE